ncbi:hypothetical protein [Comamonas endophytica]|uniref:Uncharacterized protein n=1 Tax=Comamonas endophytica TaxID=2949090 RepID=A0ABY6G917_9BURK|nr:MULTISPECIES: hypothetical protein [unclassified Acidovorax]MCD2511499.1 hypothetical protein [Acidovorax sp. D4N7]UYG50887.1 hypothetical protein M9799_12400 [Acidovorax sp. 5MLIR]
MSLISSSGPSIQANQFAPASSQKSVLPNWENIGSNERTIALVEKKIADMERQFDGVDVKISSAENVKIPDPVSTYEKIKRREGGKLEITKDIAKTLMDNLNIPSGYVLMNGRYDRLTSDEYAKVAGLITEQRAELQDWSAKWMNTSNEKADSADNSKAASLEALKSACKELDALVSKQEEDRRKVLYPNEA